VELLEELSSLVRDTTQVTQNLVTLDDEVGYIKKYLDLQKARFGEGLHWHIDITEEASAMTLPKMCLQPLVENSINHGARFKKGEGTIWIDAAVENGQLAITVRDNGGGMSPERIDEMNAALATETIFRDRHIGLNNVATRLRLLYEARARLWLEAAPEGLSVHMTIPTSSEL
jgi:two-component system sensor histidine kinase YesM